MDDSDMTTTVANGRNERSRLKVMIVTDGPDAPTGFGNQHRHLAAGLAEAGHTVYSIAMWDPRPLWQTDQGYYRFPAAGFNYNDKGIYDRYLPLLKPDVLITLGDMWMFECVAALDLGCRWFHWLPVDAEPYPRRWHPVLKTIPDLVLMSQFAYELFAPHLAALTRLHFIPHGVDPDVFRPLRDRHALRRRWSERTAAEIPDQIFLLISRDRNQWRKQQPLLLEALSKVRDSRVRLLFHCDPHDKMGWDLEAVADLYGVRDRVIFSRMTMTGGVPSSDLNELDNIADLRVSATQGEGFGLVTAESNAAGLPSLITDYTTSRELTYRCGGLVSVKAWTIQPSAKDPYRRPIVDTEEMASRIEALMRYPEVLERWGQAARNLVLRRYTADWMVHRWLKALTVEEPVRADEDPTWAREPAPCDSVS